jgi:Skp family chaperone for outer membrane proteins
MKSLLVVGIFGIAALTACGGKAKSSKDTGKTSIDVAPVKSGDLKIAYYVQDSLVTGFKYYAEKDKQFRAKQMSFTKDLENRSRSYENWVQSMARAYEAKTLTPEQLGAFEQERPRREQALMQFQQTKGAELDKESQDLQELIMNMIKKAGEKFSEANKVDILLMHGDGGQVNFINKRMDVTQEFVNFLNQEQDKLNNDLKPAK